MTTPPLDGLGATLDQLRGVCRNDPEALDAIDRATQNAVGNPGSIGNIVTERPHGNTAAKALRRLRKDRPDLHAEVLARRLSPHAAAVEAGFRPKTLTVLLSVDGFARAIAKHLTAGQRAELAGRAPRLQLRQPLPKSLTPPRAWMALTDGIRP